MGIHETATRGTASRRGFVAGGAAMLAGAGVAALAGVPGALANEGAQAQGAPETEWDYAADVVVVGAGGAGLSAACAAAEQGASAIVIEKMPYVGGDTALSGQAFLGPWPEQAKADGNVDDSVEDYLADQRASHDVSEKGLRGEALADETPYVQRQYELSVETLEWTRDSIGIQWVSSGTADDPVVGSASPCPNFSTKNQRAWMPSDVQIVPALKAASEELGVGVGVLLGCEAAALLRDEGGRVIGVHGFTGDGTAVNVRTNRAVVLATGEFCGDRSLMSRYLPASHGIESGGSMGDTGDGIRMAREVGARLVDMDLGMHWYPFEAVTNSNAFSFTLFAYGHTADDTETPDMPGIFVNYDGERFVSETSGYKYIGEAIAQQHGHEAFYLLDSHDNAAPLSFAVPTVNRVRQADTLAELAGLMGVDPDALQATVDRYNGFAQDGADGDFGKLMQGDCPIDQGPFYAVLVRPRPYATYGGVDTDPDSHVLGTDGNAIEGLFAAGIVTGSYAEREGMCYNGGVAQALTFGRQVGLNAAAQEAWCDGEAADGEAPALSSSEKSEVDCSDCHADGRPASMDNKHGF